VDRGGVGNGDGIGSDGLDRRLGDGDEHGNGSGSNGVIGSSAPE
jgi:hypothetical protein